MKRILFLPLSLILPFLFFGQKAMSFEEAQKNRVRISWLDSTYASGIDSDSLKSVFKPVQQEQYIQAYKQLLYDLGNYLYKNGFTWQQPVKGFNRIYFDKTGKIDYFLYSFRAGQLDTGQELQFKELLHTFIQNYRFPLAAGADFAQCSPVTYTPPAEKQ